MERDDLIQFLRDNLRISISGEQRHAMMGDGTWYEIEASLTLGDVEISTDSFTLDVRD